MTVRRWPTVDELRAMSTEDLAATANRLGFGRCIMELDRRQVIKMLAEAINRWYIEHTPL